MLIYRNSTAPEVGRRKLERNWTGPAEAHRFQNEKTLLVPKFLLLCTCIVLLRIHVDYCLYVGKKVDKYIWSLHYISCCMFVLFIDHCGLVRFSVDFHDRQQLVRNPLKINGVCRYLSIQYIYIVGVRAAEPTALYGLRT